MDAGTSQIDNKRPLESRDTSRTVESSANVESLERRDSEAELRGHDEARQFRVYKRRWFGLFQLVLLNIVVSWDWLTFSASSKTSSEYFGVTETAINWLSTGFLFAFVAISPLVLWTLHFGPKPAILAASGLILIGNWIRYAGARSNTFGVVMFGQILIGLAQPFVLTAPTRYSDLWFTDRGRISATAVASLANPLGGALGQLIGPLWATSREKVPDMVLYTAIIASIAAIPSLFVPAAPPTPPSASSSLPKTPLLQSVRSLWTNKSFWLIFIPFSVYVGFFNALSSVLNQVLFPYGYSEDQAGIGGALLIVVGLLSSAIVSPIIDRNHAYQLIIKLLVPIIGLSYLCFVFAPPTKGLPAPYIILAILGASSFSLVPVALEYLVEVTWPASPEVSSVVNWTGGQLLGAIFIIIMGALKDEHGEPKNNMQRALVFEAIIALAIVPIPLLLGVKKFGFGGEDRKRYLVDGGETRSGATEAETR
ncbi:MFS general substrate transporter [Tothia fuscella]|uniref:MFS general substrate transporter n=1 Tax=Tothia fuscella TaxID=1048955 RepID=A0A9P4NZH8_9PEZI|nr:MFS general substrate transporter [Tothia fuscella]